MKFNFRKIASVLASTVMLSSTVALAAAANYPSPFVSSGVADVAVVYGSSAAQTDIVAATQITSNLQSKLAAEGASGPTKVEGGDFVKLEKDKNKYNLGENMTDFWTSLGPDQLSKVLSDGVYMNDANNEFDYTQKIALGSGMQLTFFKDTKLNDGKPVIGFDLPNNQLVMNYTMDFTDAAEGETGFAKLEHTDLSMLGRQYYLAKAQGTTKGVKLTLLDSANSATVTEGEAAKINLKGVDYDVSISWVNADNAILKVNGVETGKLQDGDVAKVGTDLYIGVKNILYNQKESGISQVQVSLGSGKIVLESGEEVLINNVAVSDMSDSLVNAYITNTTTNINKIVLEWKLEKEAFVAPGTDLVLPGFETIKLSMGGFNAPGKEVTTLKNDGDDVLTLSTELLDGAVDMPLLFLNSSKTGIKGLGESADDRLITSLTGSDLILNGTAKFFVGTWINGNDAESYYFEYTGVSGTSTENTTTIKNVANGEEYKLSLSGTTSKDIGEIKLTLNAANKNSEVVNVTVSKAGSTGTVTNDMIVTKDGLKIHLPVNTATVSATEGAVNLTTQPTSWVANFTEENEDGDINVGSSFTATVLASTDGPTISAVSLSELDQEKGSDVKVAYVQSALATKTIRDTSSNPDTLEVWYAGAESTADVYISETGAAVVSAEGGATKILSIKDSEVASVSAKNLVVVGGSCINSVAASLLGGALCGADFEAKAGVGAGAFLIKTFARDNGGVATLVAGYNAEDTTSAAKYLTTQTVDTTVGKEIKKKAVTFETLS